MCVIEIKVHIYQLVNQSLRYTLKGALPRSTFEDN